MDGDRIVFEWFDWIVEKLSKKHNVEPEEAEECFFDPERKIRRVEDGKYQLFGRSDDGRYLFVVFAQSGYVVRVVSARNMTAADRRYYGRK